MDFEELSRKCLEWADLAQNRDQKLIALPKTVKKLWFTLPDVTRSASF
jgi:hypothetical protein